MSFTRLSVESESTTKAIAHLCQQPVEHRDYVESKILARFICHLKNLKWL